MIRGAGELRCIERQPSREEYDCGRSHLVLEWTQDGAVLSRVSGHGLPDLADAIAERWSAAARAAPSVQLLMDFAAMPTYDTAFRKTLTQWAVEHRNELQNVDLLSGSKLVTMGAGVANIVLGGLVKVHDDAPAFDARVRAAGLQPARR